MSESKISNIEFTGKTNKELVEWWNDNCGENEKLKSFRTVSIGVARCEKLQQQINDAVSLEEETEELSDEEFQALMMKEIDNQFAEDKKQEEDAKSKSAARTSVIEAIKESGMPQDCLIDSPEYKSALRSNNVAFSWLDEDVHRRRTTRNRVKVTHNGYTNIYKSVFRAFTELELPMRSHVKFRTRLKRNNSLVFEFEGKSYLFEVIPKEEGKKK